MRSSLFILGVALVLLLLTYIVYALSGWAWHEVFYMMLAFLVLLTILTHQINLNSVRQQGSAMIIPYLISTVLKLLLSAGFLIVFVKIYPDLVKDIIISFLLYYATSSTVEIILVNRRTKGKKF
jgi:O-antigen/teichoic acid export membrane protein